MLKSSFKTDANTSSANLGQKIDHVSQDLISIKEQQKNSFGKLPIQRKLSVGAIDDPLEREADAMADRVMRMPENGLIQRKCSGCEEEENIRRKPITSFIQKSSPQSLGRTSAQLSQKIAATRGRGSSLSYPTKSFMESRFRTDLSNVKIHKGNDAQQMSRELNAQAFTVGNDIFFNTGKFAPDTAEGKHLLAHELTHTIQQSNGNAIISRQVEPNTENSGNEEEASPLDLLSREEEISHSRTSPGGFEIKTRPLIFTINNFEIEGYRLKTEHENFINEVISALTLIPSGTARLIVVGHTSTPGSPEYNMRLSERRARFTARKLRQTGIPVTYLGVSEHQPITDSDSVSGRMRNRRVDIHVIPTRLPEIERDTDPPQIPEQPETPTIEDPPIITEEEQEEEERSFCVRHPLICGAIGIGVGLGVGITGIILCLKNPLACLPIIPDLPDIPDIPEGDEPDRDPESQPKRPCIASINLPTGTLRAEHNQVGIFHFLTRSFEMKLRFHENEEDCECGRGEYKQLVKGYFEKIETDGSITPIRHFLKGRRLSRTIYKEDSRSQLGDLPYGHRYIDYPLRLNLRPNPDGDEFLEDRRDGCRYKGYDSPGFSRNTLSPGEGRRFRLDFKGAAVDGGLNRRRISRWREWSVVGEHREPQSTPPVPDPDPDPTPDPIPQVEDNGPQIRAPRNDGPTIGPVTPGSRPAISCSSGEWRYETRTFMRRLMTQKGELMASEDTLRRTVAYELEHLIRTCMNNIAPARSPHQEHPRHRRIRHLRAEARRRVFRLAGVEGLLNTDYAR